MRDRTIFAKLLALLAILSLVAAACGGDDDGDETGGESGDTSAPATTPEDEIEDGGEVTYASDQEPTGWNPLTASDNLFALNAMLVNVLPSPFYISPELEVTLDENLMESAELTNDDPQTIEYVINDEAVWDDGTPISAEDFIYAWRLQNGTDFPEAEAVSTTGYEDIESVEGSEDGKTVTVTYATPFSEWQFLFTTLLPAHIMSGEDGEPETADDFNGGFNTGLDEIFEFSGGPFKFEDYTPEQSVNLVPNEAYWGPAPNLERVVVVFGLDAPALPDALENDEIDVAYPQPQVDLVQQIEALAPDIDTQINFGLTFEHIDFNLDNTLLAQLEVRQAIALGLDRTALVESTVQQFDDRAERLDNRIWLNSQPEYEAHGGEFAEPDPERAREILEGAGFTEGSDGIYANAAGERLSFRISTTGGNQLREDSQLVIQDQLAEVGIEITIDNLPGGEVFTKFFPDSGAREDRDYDIALFAWVGGPNAISGNVATYSTEQGNNHGYYSNPEVDSLFEEAVANPDVEEAAEIGQQIDEILWQDLPTIPLYVKPTYLPFRANIANVVDNASNQGPLWNIVQWGLTAQ